MIYLKTGASLAVIAAMGCASAQAQETENTEQQRGVQEIVVTATKRSADLQDVAVAVQALGEETLDQLGVCNHQIRTGRRLKGSSISMPVIGRASRALNSREARFIP